MSLTEEDSRSFKANHKNTLGLKNVKNIKPVKWGYTFA